ncbi:MAG: ketoacyl-ACP synthase III [Helicobacteraceae bacterium]|nr:ketoacyl-ACP synthase III [Helicobacteraceae bacterium]
MANLEFENIAISAITTTVGDRCIKLEEEKEKFGFDDISFKRLQKTTSLDTRYIVSEGITTTDLCIQSANKIFNNTTIKKDEIDALLFVTQSPDFKAPSSAIIMQDRLGLPTSCIAFDINLGCSGFVYGLFTAFSYINSGMKKVLLCCGDVNSYFSGERDKIFTPLMGDAGCAVMIEAKQSSKSFFELHSDGSGYKHLIIPAGALKEPTTTETLIPKLREDGGIRRDEDLFMNGKEVFNFAIKTVPPLIKSILESSNIPAEKIDFFVLHQANPYILKTIASRLKVEKNKVPLQTASEYGNQNSASIAGTINGYLSEEFESKKLKLCFAGFGIGLSWAACVLECDNIYAPKVEMYHE